MDIEKNDPLNPKFEHGFGTSLEQEHADPPSAVLWSSGISLTIHVVITSYGQRTFKYTVCGQIREILKRRSIEH